MFPRKYFQRNGQPLPERTNWCCFGNIFHHTASNVANLGLSKSNRRSGNFGYYHPQTAFLIPVQCESVLIQDDNAIGCKSKEPHRAGC